MGVVFEVEEGEDDLRDLERRASRTRIRSPRPWTESRTHRRRMIVSMDRAVCEETEKSNIYLR